MSARRSKKNLCPSCGRPTAWMERPGGRMLEVIKQGRNYTPAEDGRDLILDAGGDLVSGTLCDSGKEFGFVPHFMVCERARRAMDLNRRPAARAPRKSRREDGSQIAMEYEGYTRADDIQF